MSASVTLSSRPSAHPAGVTRRMLGAEGDEVVVADGLGADEARRLRHLCRSPDRMARHSFAPG